MLLRNHSFSASERPAASTSHRWLIVGNRGGAHVGDSFEYAASRLGLQIELIESKDAMRGSALLRRLRWYLSDRTPLRLKQFGADLLRYCAECRPQVLLTTGIAPVDAHTLGAIQEMGIKRANYLTDDPWNPAHRARWFFRALSHYNYIFTTRRANIEDLRSVSHAAIHLLRFGYDPRFFFPVQLEAKESAQMESEVMFAGGGFRTRSLHCRAGQGWSPRGPLWELLGALSGNKVHHARPD